MFFGTPYACGFGSPQNHLRRDVIQTSAASFSHRVFFQAAPVFANGVYGIYSNSVKVYTTYAETDLVGPIIVPAELGVQSIQIFRQGHNAEMDLARRARVEEAETSSRVMLTWPWPLEFMGGNITPSFLSNWVFTDVAFPKLTPQIGLKTRGYLTYELIVVAGIATVTLYGSGRMHCRGSGAVGTTITLAALDYGNISALVTVSLTASDESGNLTWRKLAGMRIKRDSVIVGTVYNTVNEYTGYWIESSDLAGGTYSYTLNTLSDLGIQGADSAPVLVDVNAAPASATNLAYVSGAASALIVQWTSSTTPGASYNLYIQGPVDPHLDLNAPIAIPAGTTSYTLPAQIGYPGIVRVLLRAVKAGIEERKGALLEIELATDGSRIAPRPNDMHFGSITITGTSIAITATYSISYEKASPVSAQLFLRLPETSYNFASPDATAILGAAIGELRFASLALIKPSGNYYGVLKAVTSAGVQSLNTSEELALVVDDSAISAPAFIAQAARG